MEEVGWMKGPGLNTWNRTLVLILTNKPTETHSSIVWLYDTFAVVKQNERETACTAYW